MEQFVGQLYREAFEDFFGGRTFRQLLHCIFEHLSAGAFALIAKCADKRNALAAFLLLDKFADFFFNHGFGGRGGFLP